MRILFLGTGPTVRLKPNCDSPICKAVKAKKYDSKDYRRNFSMLLSSGEIKVLLDASPDIEDQVERFNVESVDYILISHGHKDHCGGLIFAVKHLNPKKVLMHERTFQTIKKRRKLTRNFRRNIEAIPLIQFLKPDRKIGLNGLGCLPFLFEHAILEKENYPTFAFIFFEGKKRIVIIPDYILDYRAFLEKMNYIRGCELLVTNASVWKTPQFGGASTAIRNVVLAKRWGVKRVILTHVGHTVPSYEIANREIKKVWSKAEIAFDGMEVKI